MGDFHFIRPLFLLLIPVGLGLSYLLWSRTSTVSSWTNICDPHLIKHLLIGKQIKHSGVPFLGMMLAWIIASAAIAGPTWQRLPQPAQTILEGRVIVFDLSLSMDSTDVKPTRLRRARYKLSDLIHAGASLQQGLVVFAGDAFVVAPLTDDIDTLINLVPSLNTQTIPVQGSRADLGLEAAATLISNSGLSNSDIVLITDGISLQTVNVAKQIASTGFSISVMSVGTDRGEPVPLANGELLKDRRGNIVIPAVDHEQLKKVALAGRGRYVEISTRNDDIDLLMESKRNPLNLTLDQQLKDKPLEDRFTSDQWKDFGPWLILPLLLLLSLGFRRGWILSITFCILPLISDHAYAFTWEDLWLRTDQQAAKNYKAEEYEQIPDHAPAAWQGALKYRSGDFNGAINAYSNNNSDDAISHYNHGNALVQSRALEDALIAYQRALDIDPKMEDAIFNKSLVEALLKQQTDLSNSPGESNEETEEQQDQESGNRAEEQQKAGQNGQSAHLGNSQIAPEKTSSSNNGSEEEPNFKPDQEISDEPEGDSKSSQTEAANQAVKEASKEPDPNEDIDQALMSEQQQAMEQWLQRIPDDPGGLLRRKFSYQYSIRPQQSHTERW